MIDIDDEVCEITSKTTTSEEKLKQIQVLLEKNISFGDSNDMINLLMCEVLLTLRSDVNTLIREVDWLSQGGRIG